MFLVLACVNESDVARVKAPPAVLITAPEHGAVLRQGVDVVATGEVADSFDDPETLAATWAVAGAESPAGLSAEGEATLTLATDGLALGPLTLTLAATDSDGQSSFDEITLDVWGPLGPPTVTITAPEDGATSRPGDSITFLGSASDTWTPADDLTLAWSSDVDGPLEGAISGDGQSALVTSALTEGTHVVTLTAVDSDGESGSASITVVLGGKEPDPPEEPEPGDLIFTEFMVNPSVDDWDGEWVELYNTSGRTLDLAGYSFHDDGVDAWTFDASVEVEPHGYVVLCANPDPAQNGGVPCDGWFFRNPDGERPPKSEGHGTGIAIANNDDELVLTGPDGIDIDAFDYDDTDSDPIEAAAGFGLDPALLDGALNDDIGNWCVQTSFARHAVDPGTPGFVNDPCF